MAGASTALAESVAGHEHLLPERNDHPAFRASSWQVEGAWHVAPEDRPGDVATRVAALMEVADDGPALAVEARGVDGEIRGPWLPLEETFRGDGSRVAVVDLDQPWPAAELRIADGDEHRVGDLAWELLEPNFPDAGERARLAVSQESVLSARPLDPALASIGVISREEWGARPTACSATEDNWYRMAIHHTAGSQTSGGSVAAAVRAVQAYHQDSGTWCDIAYQFLVGHDGSLYEGRQLHLRSGATGGNNAGNMAVSFVGCYHPNGCPAGSHSVTGAMMDGALRLIQTAARLHDISLDASSILGHRDYGNATACPGDFVHGRLDELRRAGPASYAAEVVERSWLASESSFQLEVGETRSVWVEFENVGGSAWEPGVTFLAPTTPRDQVSPLANDSWPSPGRAATVSETVEPGETARFVFEIHGESALELEQQFSLVHEGVTWFGDAPLGGGPGDDAVVVQVRISEPGDSVAPGDPIDDGHGGAKLAGGCQAGAGSPSGAAALALLIALVALRPTRCRARAG